MKTPELFTERLTLRPFNEADARDVFEGWETDPDVARYMFWESHNDFNKTIEWVKEEVEKIEAEDWYRWAITLKESGELVGTGLIYLNDETNQYEIAYNLKKSAWGKGYTTEAMKRIIQYAKEELGIKTIMGSHAKENPASGKVMEKLGFKFLRDIPYECHKGEKVYEGKEYQLDL